MEVEITGKRKKGRPRKSRKECIKKDLEWYGLRRKDAYNQRNGASKLEQKLLTPASQDKGIKTDVVTVVVYLNEKLNFYDHILVRNAQINARNKFRYKAKSKLPQESLITIFTIVTSRVLRRISQIYRMV